MKAAAGLSDTLDGDAGGTGRAEKIASLGEAADGVCGGLEKAGLRVSDQRGRITQLDESAAQSAVVATGERLASRGVSAGR